jgi:hypothetical protein
MKCCSIGFASTFVGIVLLASGVVLGQDVLVCVPDDPDHLREIRRVPRADTIKDERGDSVYKINGNESWRRTDIEVRRGQKIEISASGTVAWAADGSAWTFVTPQGTRPPYRDGWNYNHFPFPEAGIGSLVMRIGKGVYPAGQTVAIEAEDDGFIEFMVNDDVLGDNSGSFYVKLNIRT